MKLPGRIHGNRKKDLYFFRAAYENDIVAAIRNGEKRGLRLRAARYFIKLTDQPGEWGGRREKKRLGLGAIGGKARILWLIARVLFLLHWYTSPHPHDNIALPCMIRKNRNQYKNNFF